MHPRSKHEDDFKKSRQLGQPSTIAGGVPRTSKKLPTWARQNKGLAARAARDQVVYEDDVGTGKDPAQAKAHLAKKAAIYDKIRCVLRRSLYLCADLDLRLALAGKARRAD